MKATDLTGATMADGRLVIRLSASFLEMVNAEGELMNVQLRLSLVVIALIVVASCSALAQDQNLSIRQLQDQIHRMENLESDPQTPQDVRDINRSFLEARRTQLRDLLIKNISALRKYQSSVSTALTADENKTLDNTIVEWQNTLHDLKAVLAGEETRAMGGGDDSSMPPKATNELVNTNVRAGSSAVPVVNTSTPLTTSPVFAPLQVSGPACYPNAPPKIGELADAVTFFIIDKQPALSPGDAISRHFEKLMYFAIADAVLDEKDKVNLRKLHVQQFVAETARTDKQTTASARSAGSVSAIEKPGFSTLLGFAIDHGAVEKQVTATTLTLSSSPYALLVANNGGDTSENHKKYDFFNRIGVSATFDIANQADPLSNARRKQLSEWSIKVRLNKDYSSRSPIFQDFWDREVKNLIEQRAIIYVSAFDSAFNNELSSLYTKLKNEFEPIPPGKSPLDVYLETHTGLSAADKKAGLKQEIICRLKTEVYDPVKSGTFTVSAGLREEVNRTLKDLATADLALDEGKKNVEDKIKELNEKPTSTLGYSNMRPATGSAYSVFKFLHERKAYNPVNLVANAGFSLYQNPDPKMNQQTMRDIAFALSFDGSAGRSPFVSATSDLDQSKITFSFTGRYQRMFENRHQPKKKADIALAQFKLEIPLVTGVSLPFSVSFANATELIKEKHVRANFGFSLDTDKLFLLAKLKKP